MDGTVRVFKPSERMLARFWVKVDKSGNCWTWKWGRPGYHPSRPTFGGMNAARFIWKAINGGLSRYEYVCHKCDNDQCVRPDHLFVGTAHDNAQDMVDKGRRPSNVRLGPPLTLEQVAEIKRQYSEYSRTSGSAALARRYGVSRETITAALTSGLWDRDSNPEPAADQIERLLTTTGPATLRTLAQRGWTMTFSIPKPETDESIKAGL